MEILQMIQELTVSVHQQVMVVQKPPNLEIMPKSRSFLHNTYADGLDSAVWKRDLNITVSSDLSRCVLCIVGSLTRSKENLVDCVELTSVRTRDCVSPPIPLYSAVNKSTKKKKPEEKTTKTVSQVTLEGLAGGEITVKELKELSSILVSTNTALQRNSNLRASLTISVKKPGKTVKFTTPKTARKNKGPSYVPTKCPPLAPSPLLGRVAASALGSGSALPTSPLALPPSLVLLSSPRNQGKGSPHAKRRFAVNPPVKQISPLVKPVPDVLTESSEEEEEEEEIEVEEEEDQGDKEEEKMEDENEDHFDKDESRNEKPKEKLRKVNIDAEHVMTNKKGNDRCEDTTNHSRVESRNQVSVETGKSGNFDVEKSTKLNPEPFVRSYRTNRSSRGVPANRTVTSKSGNSSDKTSNPLNLETKSTNKSFPEVRPSSQVLKNTESVLLNDSKNGNKVKKDLSKNSYVELDKSEAKSELTSRLYKSETGNHSVRERQLLLLQKTGGINNNDIRFTTTHQVNKKEQGPRTKSEEPRVLEETRNNSKVSEGTRNTTEEPKTAEGTGNKTTRNQKTIPKSDSVKEVREVLQGQRANHGSPNTAVLRNTSGRSETVSVTAVTAGPSSKNPPAETKTRSSQIHENEKTRGHFVSSSHTESALHQQEKESEYWNCRKLHYSKDSLLDPDYIDIGDIDESNTISEAINNYSELVKAVPALILEDLDSTSLCEEEYEPISHQGHEISSPPNSRYAEEGSDVYSDYSMTASSRGEKCGFGNGSARSSILERGSQVSDRSDEWIDIDTDDDYDTRRFSRPQLSFVRASIRASKRRGSGGGAAEVAQEWNRAVRDLSRPVNHKDNEYSDDDLYESIYEVIRPRINDRDPEVTSTDKSVHFNLDSNSNIEKSNPNLPSSPAVQITGAKTNNSVHLMKLAEAANKKMKKMKNELNLTTGEITRSLLRMNKKNGHNVDNSTVPGNRRKATRKPAINKLGPDSDKMFYITLTIEEDGGEESPLNIVI
ncbi:uncharacterized protein LOC111701619 [Eurytemora carolleeae]|uniref:uncharacterized protein LOC111701619 n=1 Tax=Eurytemora carolleeae TaxID=1294199 RepID=UPI000C791261|nr:uncharacterized protein LOC111701619 [Eurytemora carolleeae]|eukprot:XP_023328752.1 uncharacterized protein LOC111701619 [Eurytemora affinis]